MQEGGVALLERAADPQQRPETHAVDGKQLDVHPPLPRQGADGAVVTEGEDRGVEAARPAARGQIHHELLEPAQPQSVDEVRDANGHAWKVGTAPGACSLVKPPAGGSPAWPPPRGSARARRSRAA